MPGCGVAAARRTHGFVTVTLQDGEVVAVVDPTTGGRLTSFTVRGEELLATVPRDVLETRLSDDPARDRDWYRGSFPLAPWAGTLDTGTFEFDGRKYALPVGSGAVHGLVAERSWDLVGVPTRTSGTLAVRIGPRFPGGWPFDGLVQQSFRLDQSSLRMRLEVHCLDGRMPAIAGFHPWFRRSLAADRPATVSFAPGRRLIHHAGRHVPTADLGPRPWDDLFLDVAASPSIAWPEGPTLTLVSSAPIWVYYERMPEGFCIEPWTGPFNGLDTNWAAAVSPGNPLILELAIVIRQQD
jgi:aldose 1-epimerase